MSGQSYTQDEEGNGKACLLCLCGGLGWWWGSLHPEWESTGTLRGVSVNHWSERASWVTSKAAVCYHGAFKPSSPLTASFICIISLLSLSFSFSLFFSFSTFCWLALCMCLSFLWEKYKYYINARNRQSTFFCSAFKAGERKAAEE